ncbi:hypothetical protein PDESU_01475 [Pontiella desulfatans]|uniref:BACON domain-containing protein n=1 Tax=Pontiella desulfatans TaxID=2750659 RepID=A0A6C2TZZ9_PONDE|nr:zinc-dependent metalloprotease family protein [Pontiella desulfatans]VGO12921.1 hypothetical protein PDESU_01475 [Pontiella desulfatans]
MKKHYAILILVALAVASLVVVNVSKKRGPESQAPDSSLNASETPVSPGLSGAPPAHLDAPEPPAAPALTQLWDEPVCACAAPIDHGSHAHIENGAGQPNRSGTFDPSSFVSLSNLKRGDNVVIPLFDGERVTGQVNLAMQEDGYVRIGGALSGTRKGSFSMGSRGDEFSGTILLPEKELAYTFAAQSPGSVLMQERPLSEVICHPLPLPEHEPVATATIRLTSEIPPLLSSRPAATAVLYLDFDGETVTDPDWNSGSTIVAEPSALSNADIEEVWKQVKEDFWPFDIDVTTDVGRYNSAPVGSRMRCIITPTSDWYGSAGGVAYLDSFDEAGSNFSTTIPCWVFVTSSAKSHAEAISHELGHTFGLSHDGRISPSEGYYQGHGSGAVGWAPIMGVGYYQELSQWSKGEYLSANQFEDDLAVIGNAANGFGLVADDAGDVRANSTALDVSGGSAGVDGIISSAADVDWYAFTVDGNKQVAITAYPAAISPNLDIHLELQDASGALIGTSNPDTALHAGLAYDLLPGTYHVKIQGTGHGDVLGDGYSSYGSIGHYALAISSGDMIAAFPMDTDPGWSIEGQWAFGQPQGLGNYQQDPSSGFTGSNVYGYNLAGDYANNIPQYWLTTTPIDCSGHTDVHLQFQRWLGVESSTYDHAEIQVSNDGTTWSNVWSHVGSAIGDSSWLQMDYDVSAVADGHSTVYVRWGMGPTDSSQTHPGWNIDDVKFIGLAVDPNPAVHVFTMDSDPGWSTEGDWAFGMPLGIDGDPSSGYTGNNVYGYNLAGDYSNNIPRHWLTTPALDCSGQSNLELKFWRWLGVENSTYDHATVEISTNGTDWITLWDHVGASFSDTEWTEMQFDVSAVADGQPTVHIRWGMGPTDWSATYCGWNIDDVSLSPEPVKPALIATSQNSYNNHASFGESAPDDILEIWNGGSSNMAYIVTTDVPWLSMVPGSGTSTGEVDVLTVDYETATIQQAGYHDALITITAPDAANSPMTIPVSVYIEGAQLNVSESSMATVTPVGSSPSDLMFDVHNTGIGSMNYSVSTDVAWLYPSPSSGMVDAFEADTIALSFDSASLPAGSHTGMVEVASYHAEGSPRFIQVVLDVVDPMLDHFTWEILNPQLAAMGVALVARDADGNPFTSFAGSANLSAWQGSGDSGEVHIGLGGTDWDYPLHTFYHDARTQVIYQQPEMGGAATLSSLSLNVLELPSLPMNNWTIRMRHTDLYAYGPSPEWESDWATVYQATETITSTGWVEFVFATPFEYNGSDHLMVDFSFNNGSWEDPSGLCAATDVGEVRSIYFYTDSGYNDPLDWPLVDNPAPYTKSLVPDVRFGVGGGLEPLALSPINTGSFVDGVWTGELAVAGMPSNIWLVADDGNGHVGSFNFIPEYLLASTTGINGQAYWGYPVEYDHSFSVWSSSSNVLGYSATSDVTWLELPVSNGTLSGEVDMLSVSNTAWDVPDRGEEFYPEYIRTGTVSIVSAQAANSPLEIPVVYRWTEAPLGSLVWSAPSSVTADQEFFVTLQAKNIYGHPKQFIGLEEFVDLQVIGGGVGLGTFDLSPFSFTDESSGTIILTGSGSATLHATVNGVDANHFIVVNVPSDADGDGLPDAWEIKYFGSTSHTNANPDADPDSDGNGYGGPGRNWDEWVMGTDPTNANSILKLAQPWHIPGTGYVIEWQPVTGRVYTVEWAGNLTNTFEVLESNITHPQNSYTDTVHTAVGGGFYNLKVELEN